MSLDFYIINFDLFELKENLNDDFLFKIFKKFLYEKKEFKYYYLIKVKNFIMYKNLLKQCNKFKAIELLENI